MTVSPDSPRDLYVLGMLSRGKTYGHELMKVVRVSHADRWVSLSEKHVYYVLEKLARKGWVTETEERDGALPARRVYELTAAGRAALVSLLRSEVLREAFLPSPFDAVFGTLAYSEALSQAELLELLRARRDVLARRSEEDELPDGGRSAEKQYGYLARALYQKHQLLLRAEIGWLDGVIRRVRRSDWNAMRVPDVFLEADGRPGERQRPPERSRRPIGRPARGRER
jgi:DNA-binding PadR family transcriptional regulator